MEYDVVTEDGSRYPFVGNFDLSVAKYADKKPVIDGKFDKNEWDSNTAMYADKADQDSTDKRIGAERRTYRVIVC